MAATDVTRGTARGDGNGPSVGRAARRLATETKQAFKTSEFWMSVVVIVMILVSAVLIKGGDTGNGTDEFIARQAWLYVAIVTGAYAIGRGLAKAGSREPYTADDDR
jgi:uncharacterized membrane protein